MLDIPAVLRMMVKPAPFERAGLPIWKDPYVSRQLLAAHLDPTTEAASRRPAEIDRSVAWIVATLGLKPGDTVLDLGCGPGLYAQRLARLGMRVTGVDFSEVSIAYAREQASKDGLDIDYRLQDYRTLEAGSGFAAAMLVYGDYCVLNGDERKDLLRVVRATLRARGRFVLDATTRSCRKKYGLPNRWYAAEKGFWSDKPHIVLEHGFDYPEEKIWLDQHIVVEEDGSTRVFRNWFQDFTVESLRAELEGAGFRVTGISGDLLGNPPTEDSDWVGMIGEA